MAYASFTLHNFETADCGVSSEACVHDVADIQPLRWFNGMLEESNRGALGTRGAPTRVPMFVQVRWSLPDQAGQRGHRVHGRQAEHKTKTSNWKHERPF